jgi:hypothetical protein
VTCSNAWCCEPCLKRVNKFKLCKLDLTLFVDSFNNLFLNVVVRVVERKPKHGIKQFKGALNGKITSRGVT